VLDYTGHRLIRTGYEPVYTNKVLIGLRHVKVSQPGSHELVHHEPG